MTARALRLGALGLGAGLFVYLLYEIGPGLVAEGLAAMGWGLVLIVGLELMTDVANTLGWRCTFPPADRRVGFATLFLVRIAGTAFNQVVPSGALAGEPVKVLLLHPHLPAATAWASVITAKFSYGVAQAGFATVGLGIALGRLDLAAPLWLGLATALAVTAAGLGGFLWVQRRGLFATAAGVARRAGLPGGWVAALRSIAATVDGRIRDFYRRRPRDFALSVGWHAGSFVFDVAQIYLIVGWLGLPAGPVACVAIAASFHLVQLALFFVPGGIGVREGGLVLIFTALGLPASAGLSTGIALRITQLAEAGIGLGAFTVLHRLQGSPVPPAASRGDAVGSC